MSVAVARVMYVPKQHTELLVTLPTTGFRLNKNSLSSSNPKTHSR